MEVNEQQQAQNLKHKVAACQFLTEVLPAVDNADNDDTNHTDRYCSDWL